MKQKNCWTAKDIPQLQISVKGRRGRNYRYHDIIRKVSESSSSHRYLFLSISPKKFDCSAAVRDVSNKFQSAAVMLLIIVHPTQHE